MSNNTITQSTHFVAHFVAHFVVRLLVIVLSASLSLMIYAKDETKTSTTKIGQFSLGLSYADKGQNNLAIKWLERSGNQGYLPAQINLATWYQFGYQSIDVNLTKALLWYEKAAKQGNTAAQFETAQLYRTEFNDQSKALLWYKKLASLNNSDNKLRAKAQYYLGYMYAAGNGVEQDFNQAFSWLEKSAQHENINAQYMVSVFYKKGLSVPVNNYSSLFWLKKAANNGLAKAQYELAMHYYFATQGKNEVHSIQWLKKSYQQNYPDAIIVWEALKL